MDFPAGMAPLGLPEGVDRRLHLLLDKQDRGESLTEGEQAEGRVDLSDFLSLLKMRTRTAQADS